MNNFVGNAIDLGTTIPITEFTAWMSRAVTAENKDISKKDCYGGDRQLTEEDGGGEISRLPPF